MFVSGSDPSSEAEKDHKRLLGRRRLSFGSKELASTKSSLQPDDERVEDFNQDETEVQQVNSDDAIDIQILPRDPIQERSYDVAKIAFGSENTIGILHLWVFQVRQLAFRRIFSSIHDRYGLHLRCYLSKGTKKMSDIYEGNDKSCGNMMNPIWRHTNDDFRTQTRGHFAIPLTNICHESDLNIEIICGIQVVAAVKIPMTLLLSKINEADISKDIEHRWLPLIGVDNGILEISTKVVGIRNCDFNTMTSKEDSLSAPSTEAPLSPRSVLSKLRRKRFECTQPNVVKAQDPEALHDQIDKLSITDAEAAPLGELSTIENNTSDSIDDGKPLNNEERELWDLYHFGISEIVPTQSSPMDSIFSSSRVSNPSEISTTSHATTAFGSEFFSYGNRIHDLESRLKKETKTVHETPCITRRPIPGIILFDPNSLPEHERKDFIPSHKKDLTRRRRSLPIPSVKRSKDFYFADEKARNIDRSSKKPPVSDHPETKTLRRHRSESIHGFADFLKKSDFSGEGHISNKSSTFISSPVAAPSTALESAPLSSRPPLSRRHSTGQTPAVDVGKFIRVGDCPGVVRYFGPAQFASGVWIGIELCEPKGKNDGSVNGVKYFSCAPEHGLFVRANRLDISFD